MLDTVRIRANWPVRDDLPRDRSFNLPNERSVRVTTDISGRLIVAVECSLPRLLHGHNGSVMEDQSQIDAACEKLRAKLSVDAVVPDPCEWQISRADIAWNFELSARGLILAHSCLRIPGIRNGATVWAGGNGLSWKGAKSQFIVTFYDKARKMGIKGSVLRVEVRLVGRTLTSRLPGSESRCFDRLWAIYRGILAGIPPIENTGGNGDWQEAVGAEPPEIRARIMARMAHKPERTQRGHRQRVEAEAARLPAPFSWANFLPTVRPPLPVNIQARTRGGK